LDIRTKLQHPVKVTPEADNRPLVSPIYQSVKYRAANLQFVRDLFSGEKSGFFYGRIANPTVRELELMLAGIQGRADGICVGSGMCAITTTLLALLAKDDHFIIFRESYKPTRVTSNSLLAKFGITHSLLSITDTAGIEKTLKAKKTKLILFESPTNPCLFLADIKKITSLARDHGALTVIDNTFAGMHNHGDTDIDIFVHSLTKFACGHGDTLGGVIITNAELAKAIRFYHIHIGGCLDPHGASLILRGMKTYAQRYRLQSEGALTVATWLATSDRVSNVRYPGLASHPQHDLARVQMKDFGAVISFDLAPSVTSMDRFFESLKLFHLGASIGSTESLAAPVAMFFSGDLNTSDETGAMINDRTVRISVGLEAPEDLIKDLDSALRAD
jgi:cystathionine beta-lyase/cystathionine gamma-synthase